MRIVVLFLCLLGLTNSLSAQQENIRKYKLSKIEFIGLKFYNEKEVLAASELNLGQEIDLNGLKATSVRLLKTNLFRRAIYQYQIIDDQLEVIFDVTEVRSSPCIFDNFIWFQPTELVNAIRLVVPNFEGDAPGNDMVILRIKGALQKLLQEKGLLGKVDYVYNSDESPDAGVHIFAVKFPAPFVCAIRFTGATGSKDGELQKTIKPLLNAEYSVAYLKQFAAANLLPIYRRQGFLRARILDPITQAENSPKCNNGAMLTIPVNEGIAFIWDKVLWTGNQAVATPTLDAMFGVKTGDIANGEKIDDSIKTVLKFYLKKGFISTTFSPQIRLDESNKKVSYEIVITENSQFKMGEISAPGFAEGDSKKMLGNWKLKPGDIFDALYFSEFLEKKTEDLKLRGQGKRVIGQLIQNNQTLTVNVKLSISQM